MEVVKDISDVSVERLVDEPDLCLLFLTEQISHLVEEQVYFFGCKLSPLVTSHLGSLVVMAHCGCVQDLVRDAVVEGVDAEEKHGVDVIQDAEGASLLFVFLLLFLIIVQTNSVVMFAHLL